MTTRFLDADEIEKLVNPLLAFRGMPQLNIGLSRVLAAFEGETLIEFIVVQLFPMLGPLLKVDNTSRDGGEISRLLAKQMFDYLKENQARGYLAVAESPVTVKLCERYGMQKLTDPVFLQVGE